MRSCCNGSVEMAVNMAGVACRSVCCLIPRPLPLRKKGPGIHCLHMRLISQHSAAPRYHRAMSAVP